jgi:aspartate/glutamate racemase
LRVMQGFMGVPVFDTAELHAQAAVDFMLS